MAILKVQGVSLDTAFYIKGKLASVNSFMSAHVCFTEHNFLLTSYGDQFLSNKNVRAEGLP